MQEENRTINFNKNALDNFISNSHAYNVSDSKVPGLRLAVYPGGVKTFFLYRKVNGIPKRIKIGRYVHITIENARKKAKFLNSQIDLGINPLEDKNKIKNDLLFTELYELYFSQHATNFTKRPLENKKIIDNHFIPRFGKRKINSITNSEMKTLHLKIGENSGKIIANKVINLVSTVFNYGSKNGYSDAVNPCRNVKRFKQRSRDRFLNNKELRAFFDALLSETDTFRDLFSLLIYTGVRKSNLLSMRWSDIDFGLKRWRIEESQSKNDEINIIYLADAAIEILHKRFEENQKLSEPSLFVFPGTGEKGHLVDPKRSFTRIKRKLEIFDITIHDLRRTLGSHMAISGASLPIIGAALNHKSQDSTSIYARLTQQPVLDAINTAIEKMQENPVIKMFESNVKSFERPSKKHLNFRELFS